MSPTTVRSGARALGALLVTVALAGTPTVALAEPSATTTPSPTTSPTATADPSPSATTSGTTSPAPTATADPSPTATASPSPSASPSATETTSPSPSPSTSTSTSPTAATSATGTVVPGGDAARYGVAAATGPATSTDPVLVGANYLEEQLRAAGHYFSVDYGGTLYPDYGVTADAVLALAAAGTGQDEATLATQTLADHFVDYTGFGDPTEVYAGSVAKLLNVAVAQGVDPRSFGGVDLVATLQGMEQPNGRFSDTTKYGDASNVFGQSFALIGLDRVGASVSTAAVDYLLLQQCPGGGFQLYETDAGCTDDANADPDATSMAVQALLAVGGHAAAAADGLDVLAALQGPDGGIGGGGPQTGVNANSTGLAGQAFLAGGRTAQARLAQQYLTALQLGCDVPAALRGAIAYDQDRYDSATAAGSGATTSDQDRRSTSQGLLALAGVPLGSVSAAGAAAEAPDLACATATASPSATTTATSSGPATSDPASTSGAGATSGTASPVAAAPTGSLAQTGSDPRGPVLLGLALLAVGVVAVVASRRRGAHA